MSAGYLAIVTARAGSKRLPGKNSLDLCGRPLFLWSVQAGLDCPQVAETVVSTDSAEMQALARAAGARCDALRSPALGSDTASSADVVLEALDRYPDGAASFKGLVLLQPTSPLRTAADIQAAIALFESSGAPAVVSVCEAECPPAWVGQLGPGGSLDGFVRPEFKGKRSQDLGDWHRLNGAVYVIGIPAFRAERDFKPAGTLAYVMPRERSVDIDNAWDFELARLILTERLKREGR